MNKVFNTDASFLAQSRFNNLVVSDRNSGFIDFQETSLVNHVTDSGHGWVSEGNVRLNFLQHIEGGGIDSKETGIVDLSYSQESEDLGNIGVEFINTKNKFLKKRCQPVAKTVG